MTVFRRHSGGEFAVPELESRIPDEEGYIISELSTGVTSNGGTFNLQLSNPSSSGRSAVISGVRIGTTQRATARIWDSFSSAPSGGSSVTIDNLLMDTGGGTDAGNMSANTDVSFTGTNTHAIQVLGGGQGGNTIGATARTETFIIEPDREIVVEITNNSSNDADIVITVVYFETATVFST